MKNILCICMLLAVIAGCKRQIPADILSPDETVAILHDMHIADGYIAAIPNQDSAKKTAAALYKGIYAKFGIDSVAHTKSMNFYYDHPEMLYSMYTRVTAQLKKSKDSVDKIEAKRLAKAAAAEKKIQAEAQKKRKDSLTKDSVNRAGKLKPLQKTNKVSLNKAGRLKNATKTVAVEATK